MSIKRRSRSSSAAFANKGRLQGGKRSAGDSDGVFVIPDKADLLSGRHSAWTLWSSYLNTTVRFDRKNYAEVEKLAIASPISATLWCHDVTHLFIRFQAEQVYSLENCHQVRWVRCSYKISRTWGVSRRLPVFWLQQVWFSAIKKRSRSTSQQEILAQSEGLYEQHPRRYTGQVYSTYCQRFTYLSSSM